MSKHILVSDVDLKRFSQLLGALNESVFKEMTAEKVMALHQVLSWAQGFHKSLSEAQPLPEASLTSKKKQ